MSIRTVGEPSAELPCFIVEGLKRPKCGKDGQEEAEGAGEGGAAGEAQSCIVCLNDFADGDEVTWPPLVSRLLLLKPRLCRVPKSPLPTPLMQRADWRCGGRGPCRCAELSTACHARPPSRG